MGGINKANGRLLMLQWTVPNGGRREEAETSVIIMESRYTLVPVYHPKHQTGQYRFYISFAQRDMTIIWDNYS